MTARLDQFFILFLCICLCMTAAFAFPQAAQAARIAGEDRTVGTGSVSRDATPATPAKSAAPQDKAAAAQPPSAAPASGKKIKVIGNSTSKYYHLPGMKYYDKVEAYHRVEFDSEEAAIRAGYRIAPDGRDKKQKKPGETPRPAAPPGASRPAATPPTATIPTPPPAGSTPAAASRTAAAMPQSPGKTGIAPQSVMTQQTQPSQATAIAPAATFAVGTAPAAPGSGAAKPQIQTAPAVQTTVASRTTQTAQATTATPTVSAAAPASPSTATVQKSSGTAPSTTALAPTKSLLPPPSTAAAKATVPVAPGTAMTQRTMPASPSAAPQAGVPPQRPPSVTTAPRPPQTLAYPQTGKPQPSPQATQQQTGSAPQLPPQGMMQAQQGPPASPQTAPGQTQTPAAPPAAAGQRYVTIDFDNVDIQVFIKFISELTGKNFVIDDKVKGKVTVISPKKIAVDEVYKVFESVLDVYGFATAPSGDVIKIIQSQQAKEKNMEIRLQHEAATTEDKFVTQIISLDHANPDEMKRVLDPLISKTSVILSYPPTGMLIITDVMSNIKRLKDIIEALDVEGVGEQISYIPLKYATATEAIKSLNAVFQQQKGTLAQIKIVADERTNALIIAATENDTIRVRELVTLMDKEIPKGTGLIRVYYLQNAKAEDTAKVLTSLQQQQAKTADGKPAAVSKSVQIVADKATNSLIITADTADYLIIEDVIKKLDISRSMVYLEALIMEVNAQKNFKLGVEWYGGANTGTSASPVYSIGGVSGEGGKYAITSGLAPTVAGGIPNLPSGLSFGVIGQAITATIGGTTLTFPSLSAFIQEYQSDTDVKILSTPQLLTLDNEDAEITVGKNVPYVTRQDTTTTSTINYSSYEYKDVGITLKVTPQISKDGFVRLKLDQSVTKLDSQTQDVGTGTKILAPTTLKRTAKTTITVRSGDTVVIGGLIDNYSSDSVSKVPLLGDIPILGWLFKFKSTTVEKTNLFIFITPRIILKPDDAKDIHQDKKEYMESLQEGTIKATPPKKKK